MARLLTYLVESRASRLQVQAFASGFLAALGHNPTIAIHGVVGEASFREETLEDASLILRVDTASLRLVDEVSERDRNEIERNMHRDVLETEVYPEIVFVSTEVTASKNPNGSYTLHMNGNLSLHGQTRLQTIEFQMTTQGDLLRAFGTFNLWQSDYNIQLVSVAGGALKIKDELKGRFDIVARRLADEKSEG